MQLHKQSDGQALYTQNAMETGVGTICRLGCVFKVGLYHHSVYIALDVTWITKAETLSFVTGTLSASWCVCLISIATNLSFTDMF